MLSPLCTEVLSFVWRMCGRQFAGVTQLLPLGTTQEQATAALQSMVKVLNGQLPQSSHEKLKIARDTWVWREFRSSTKFLLQAIGNSLKQVMPDSFSLMSCKPDNILAPASIRGTRCMYLPEELELKPELKGFQAAFICDDNGLRFPDFYVNEDFFRLVMTCDEGTEALQSSTMDNTTIYTLTLIFISGIDINQNGCAIQKMLYVYILHC